MENIKIYVVIAGYYEENYNVFLSNDKEKAIEVAKELWNKHKPSVPNQRYFGPWFSVIEYDTDEIIDCPYPETTIWSFEEER